MNPPDDKIDRVATGSLVQVELWQQRLRAAGIDSRVVGQDLSTSFGSALTGSIELWVRRSDLARAEEVLRELEEAEGAGPAS